MSIQHIGLDVRQQRVIAVLLRRGEIAWHDEERVDTGQPLADAIACLLRRAPASRILSPRIVAAIGPAFVQVKRLSTLPAAADPRVLARALKLNATSFFLLAGAPLRTSSVHFQGGVWWGAAYEQPVLEAIADGCARAGKHFEGCAPLAAQSPFAYGDGHVCWHDADMDVDVDVEQGVCVRVRRSHADQEGSGRSTTALLRAPLAKLDHGQALAGAYAAAVCRGQVPFFLRDGTSVASARAARRRRLGKSTLIASVVCAALLILFAPGLLAHRTRLHAERQLHALATSSALAMRADIELRRTTDALRDVSNFVEGRRSTLRVLGALSLALPESTAIASLRVDSVGGALVLVSTAGPALVAPLSRLNAFASVQLTGTITREAIGAIDIPRLTVRFRHAREKRPPT